MADPTKVWADFLNPNVLKRRILQAGIYLAAFELLKDAVIVHPREFFASDCVAGRGWMESPSYRENVLSRHPKENPLRASWAWLLDIGAVDETDTQVLRELTDARNDFAHELHSIASGGKIPDFEALFSKLRELLGKIERWWLVNVELETDPEFIGQAIDPNVIVSGRMVYLNAMYSTALGEEDAAWRFYNEFVASQGDSARSSA
ncbi:hypothetical protein [Rhodobacter lacus]|uniref:Uncharacterized protein n=1 Tax=Rhodobacter lacus TaxID=1641972 RepID=A0ABW5A474_9RHOB